MKRLEWFIARRYLSAPRNGRLLSLITWISLGGVVIGVGALVVVNAVMSGMQKEFRVKILDSTPHITVLELGASLRMHDWRGALATVLKDPSVVAARPFILSQVVIKRADEEYAQSAQLYGISMDSTTIAPTRMERDIVAGIHNLKAPASGMRPILLGSRLAAKMQVSSGDTLILTSLENIRFVSMGVSPAMRQYEVTGTFSTGMYEYDSQNVYVSLDQAQGLLGLVESDVVSGLYVQIDDPEQANEVSARLQEALDLEHMNGQYLAPSWILTNQSLFAMLELQKIGLGLILFLIVLVAAFNIVSTLVMVVAERTREIGILKTMGMSDRGILQVFVMQGAWIGIVGTALGTALGVVLCWVLVRFDLIEIDAEVYFVDRLPVSLELVDLAVIVAASVAIAFLATIYPSLQAARLQPVEAIRHD